MATLSELQQIVSQSNGQLVPTPVGSGDTIMVTSFRDLQQANNFAEQVRSKLNLNSWTRPSIREPNTFVAFINNRTLTDQVSWLK